MLAVRLHWPFSTLYDKLFMNCLIFFHSFASLFRYIFIIFLSFAFIH